MRLEQVGEFGLIERIKRKVGSTAEGVRLGIDDDAAAFVPTRGMTLLLTADIFVEGIHFDPAYATWYQIGWKVMAANLSDIAAMGGVPRSAVVSLCLPERTEVEWVEEMYGGMKDVIHRFGGSIVGGDTSASSSETVISIALTGEVENNRLTTRAGAQVGDVICVSGDLGGSIAGLKVLRGIKGAAGKSPEQWSYVMERHLVPIPRIDEARSLVTRTRVNAMIDISDGLASEVHHICCMSGTGARIYMEELPLHPQTMEVAEKSGTPPHHYALYGGEDFELLFTLPAKKAEEVLDIIEEETETPVSVIGTILEADQGVTLIDQQGESHSLPFRGYNHFSKRMIKR